LWGIKKPSLLFMMNNSKSSKKLKRRTLHVFLFLKISLFLGQKMGKLSMKRKK